MNANAVDLQPALTGDLLHLRPLVPEDLEALYAAASDPAIWAQHPEPERHQRPVFERYFRGAVDSRGALTAIDRATGQVIGSSRYYDWNPADASVKIGYTFLARSHWGGAANAEMKRLMLDHAFGWADTVWFEVGRGNLRSRRALEKIGAEYSHQAPARPGSTGEPPLLYRLSARRAGAPA